MPIQHSNIPEYIRYYELEIEYFKSSLDTRLLELLWNKYWTSTLSSSPLLMNEKTITGKITTLKLPPAPFFSFAYL